MCYADSCMLYKHMSDDDKGFSLKQFFLPFTSAKAIHLIIIIGFIVFANCLFNNFVWNDVDYLIINTDVHSIQLFHAFKGNYFNTGGQYRPITVIYFSILYSLFTTNPFYYHFMQILLHITNVVLVFIFFKKFFSKINSFLLSLIFLVHPIQVESVSYIASSDNTLFFFFGIIALIFSLQDRIDKKRAVFIFASLLLSFLTKETGFLFLLVILFYRLLFKKKGIILIYSVGILTSLLYFIIRFWIGAVYFTKISVIPIANLSLLARIINIPAIILYYLKTFFYPQQLTSDQQWTITSLDFQHFYEPLLFDLLFFIFLACFYIYLKKTQKGSALLPILSNLVYYWTVISHTNLPLRWNSCRPLVLFPNRWTSRFNRSYYAIYSTAKTLFKKYYIFYFNYQYVMFSFTNNGQK